MCGICGVWEYGASEGSVESSLLVRMRDEMTHRGPDDAGELIFDERRGGFGFRRLSIIDLSAAGHQPMHSPAGRYVPPPVEEMKALTARDEAVELGDYYQSTRHTIQVDFARYVADLHKEIKRGERRGKSRPRKLAA